MKGTKRRSVSEPSLRSLPRVFLPGADLSGLIELPPHELEKLRKVLRLGTGDPFAILPDDGSLWRCRLEGRSAVPVGQEWPDTEPILRIALAQALLKGDRLETVLRMGAEVGVARFLLFPAERSVVRWEEAKLQGKLARLRSIVREAAEQSFRTVLPTVEIYHSMPSVLTAEPEAIVLSEEEGIERNLLDAAREVWETGKRNLTLVSGPEGGWTARERIAFSGKGVTMGPLILRSDSAGFAAAAAVLLGLRQGR
jgi:16S rRNA (uracil1498-N3)-methyltransferase